VIDLRIDPQWTAEILARFIRIEVGRAGRARVVVGLSGGIDSAVAASLGTRALGPDRVMCVAMPHRLSSPESLSDARAVAAALGTPLETLDLTPIVDGFVQVAGDPGPLRLGNAMARGRMMCLFDRSAALDALVLGTSNKTELLLGYGTLHGDLASAINPLGDLYKTQVRELAEYLDVPEPVRRKPPSADLWPNQTDEADLGLRYEELDRLLWLLVDARAGAAAATAAGFAPELVARIQTRVGSMHFKRVPPVVAKVSGRAAGRDFRYPRGGTG
jgi:NAD+ synthase